MKLLTSRELLKATKITFPGGILIAKALMQIFRYNKINKIYSSVYTKDPAAFVDAMLKNLDITFKVSVKDLDNIPREGAMITISNHPLGGIDSLILIKILLSRRSDFKIMGNFLLQKIDPLKNFILPVNPFETRKEARSSLPGLKTGLSYIDEKHCVAVFPAGEVSTYNSDTNSITDREWQKSALKFIKKAEVPIVPVYFHGTNSRWFYILARIHPLLRTAKLPSEVLNKRNKTITIRIGKPIGVKEQSEFKDIGRFGRYLRVRTYSLGSNIDVKGYFLKFRKTRIKKLIQISEPCDPAILRYEIESIRKSHELFTVNNYSVFYAPIDLIPNVLLEIGRLREITFRAAGEGTNKTRDLDEFDLYFSHLVLWDNDTSQIIGSYRLGKGKEILNQYGIQGFYISTLFRIKPSFSCYLADSIELGRSFIVGEYQRKPMSLFLLWKGLLTVLLQNPDYRYLIGPVSISNDFSEFSKSIIVQFIKKNHYDPELAKFLKSRKRFAYRNSKSIDTEIIIDNANNDIRKVEKVISDVDPGFRIPVLLKKYLEVNGRIIGFNVDPNFNGCLDGLIMCDIYKFPLEYVKALSKEMQDDTILDRFAENPGRDIIKSSPC